MSLHVGESSRLRISGSPVSLLRATPASPAEYGIMNTTIALGAISLIRRRPAIIAGGTQKMDSSGQTTNCRNLLSRKRRIAASSLLGRQLRATSTCTRPVGRGPRASLTTVMSHCAASFSSSLLARMAVGVVSGENDCEIQRSAGFLRRCAECDCWEADARAIAPESTRPPHGRSLLVREPLARESERLRRYGR